MDTALKDWNKATGDLPYGVQRVFLDTLNLVKDEKLHLVWGQDYRDGKPCLVNAVATMLTTGGGHGVPVTHFAGVVGAFDAINRELRKQNINTNGYVSSLAAEILIRNFGELKPVPDPATLTVAEASHGAYVEPSDEEIAADFLAAMQAPAPDVVKQMAEEGNQVAKFADEYINNV